MVLIHFRPLLFMCSPKKLVKEGRGRHIWGCVLRTHPHICRPESSTRSFFSRLVYNIAKRHEEVLMD